jgi:hypothetical protein
MSRDDRGPEHPAIEQLRTRIGEAREIDDIVLVPATYRDYLTPHICLTPHIAADGEADSPMAMQVVADLRGDDARWAGCSTTLITAPPARVRPRDGIGPAVENLPRPS